MVVSPQPIGIERTGMKHLQSQLSQDLVSQSWGACPGKTLLQRHISDVCKINYAGYLLKRSNRPYDSEVQPFLPLGRQDESLNHTAKSPALRPRPGIIEDFSSAGSSHSALDSIPHPPQHLLASQSEPRPPGSNEAVVDDQKDPESSRLEQSLEFAASFFGIELPVNPSDAEKKRLVDASGSMSEEEILRSAHVRQNSSPIKIQSKSAAEGPRDYFQFSRTTSDPVLSSNHRAATDCKEPGDIVDTKDGHLWRSKYCVLEEGVLFFYRHQTDAESPEAHLERQNSSCLLESESSSEVATDLANSPIPSSLHHSDSTQMGGHLWEKRVALDCVGAVRSAEQDYGQNSFELCAVDENNEGTLVLRARSANEMNEWLFQFHRSIAYFVMNIMDNVGSSSSCLGAYLGDIHHSAFSHKPLTAISIEPSPLRTTPFSTSAAAFSSPRFCRTLVSTSCGQTTPLSHGHGRDSLHRRRVIGANEGFASSVPSDAPPLPFLMSSETPNRAPAALFRRTLPRQGNRGRHLQDEDTSPELSAPQSAYPETERPPSKPATTNKYVPPHLRNRSGAGVASSCGAGKYVPPHLRSQGSGAKKYVPPHLRNDLSGSKPQDISIPRSTRTEEESPASSMQKHVMVGTYREVKDDDERSGASVEMPFEEPEMGAGDCDSCQGFFGFKLGGCADPSVVVGSILDDMYIPRKASRLGKVKADPFGCSSTDGDNEYGLRVEIGAVSECGIRESNEDSYVIAGDLCKALENSEGLGLPSSFWNQIGSAHAPALFAVFDGHCGDEAARFGAERLARFIHAECILGNEMPGSCNLARMEAILRCAISKLDEEFCSLCVQGGRAWESGATALIAALVEEHLVIANLGDARGVMSRSVVGADDVADLEAAGWTELPSNDYYGSRRCLWKEVTDVHSPSRDDERKRIEDANGWITTEKEIPIGQLQRMVLGDQDVVDILKRCFADRYQPSPKAAAPQRILHISRVCGELAVSRSIGDRDFKAAFNGPCSSSSNGRVSCKDDSRGWDCPLFLPYPDDHSRTFVGDLVSNEPDFQVLRVGEHGVSDEFLLLACDGLWDVMDADDAVRVTRDLLFEKEWSAKKAAARLAELAIHLGSSDNITVIVIRFFDRE